MVTVADAAPTPSRGAVRLLAARALAYGLSGAGTVVIARFLGPDRVGDVAAATSVVTVMLVLGAFGIDQLYLQGRVDEAATRSHLWRVAGISAALAVGGSLAWPGLPPTARLCGVLIGIAAAGDQLKVLWLCRPQYDLDFATRGRRDLGMRSLSVALSVLAAVVIGTAVSVAAGTLAASLLVLIPALASGATVSDRMETLPRLRDVLRGGLPFAVSGALYTLYFQVDGAILASLSAAHEVGLYRAAYSFVFAAVAIPVAVNGDVMRSRLYRVADRAGSLWSDALPFAGASLGLGIAVAGVMRELATPLTRLLFGSAFLGASSLLAVLALAMIPHYLNSWAGNLLIAAHRIRVVVVVQGSLAALNIAGNLAAIPRYGARGAAWMTVITEGAGSGVYLILVAASRHAIGGRPETGRGSGQKG